MAFTLLDQILPTDMTTEIAKQLHKSLMTDIKNEIPQGHAMICPFATAFEKHPEDPIDYLVENHGAQVFEAGYHYKDFLNHFLPYKWSSVIIRIPGRNKIIVYYKTDHHPASLLFTAYFNAGEIITERFYYKKGEEALLSGNMFLSQPVEIPDNTVLNYLTDVAGYDPEEIFLQVQDSTLTWSNPEKIMETLQKQAEPFVTSIDATHKDRYGDQGYYTLVFRFLYEAENGVTEDNVSEGGDDSDDWHDPTEDDWYIQRYDSR